MYVEALWTSHQGGLQATRAAFGIGVHGDCPQIGSNAGPDILVQIMVRVSLWISSMSGAVVSANSCMGSRLGHLRQYWALGFGIIALVSAARFRSLP